MEYFDITDEQDNVIGKASREECHNNPKLIHRGANVYIFNSKKLDYILRVKRSSIVDTEQEKWTIIIGEHNKLGETYEQAVKRGLKEELGIENISCKKISYALIRMGYQTEYHQNYIAIYDGNLDDLRLDTNEVEKVEFIKVSDLLEDIKNNKEDYASYIESALEVILPHVSK